MKLTDEHTNECKRHKAIIGSVGYTCAKPSTANREAVADKLRVASRLKLEADSRLRKISWFQDKWLSFDKKDRYFLLDQILSLISPPMEVLSDEEIAITVFLFAGDKYDKDEHYTDKDLYRAISQATISKNKEGK